MAIIVQELMSSLVTALASNAVTVGGSLVAGVVPSVAAEALVDTTVVAAKAEDEPEVEAHASGDVNACPSDADTDTRCEASASVESSTPLYDSDSFQKSVDALAEKQRLEAGSVALTRTIGIVTSAFEFCFDLFTKNDDRVRRLENEDGWTELPDIHGNYDKPIAKFIDCVEEGVKASEDARDTSISEDLSHVLGALTTKLREGREALSGYYNGEGASRDTERFRRDCVEKLREAGDTRELTDALNFGVDQGKSGQCYRGERLYGIDTTRCALEICEEYRILGYFKQKRSEAIQKLKSLFEDGLSPAKVRLQEAQEQIRTISTAAQAGPR